MHAISCKTFVASNIHKTLRSVATILSSPVLISPLNSTRQQIGPGAYGRASNALMLAWNPRSHNAIGGSTRSVSPTTTGTRGSYRVILSSDTQCHAFIRTPAHRSAPAPPRKAPRCTSHRWWRFSQLSPRPLAVAQVFDNVSLPVLEKIAKHPHRRFRITLERRDERRANLVRVTLDVLEEITVVLVLGVHDCAGFFFEEAVNPHVEYHLPILCALVREFARGKCAIPCGVEVCEVAHACLPAYWSRSDA